MTHTTERPAFDPQRFIRQLTTRPGVYRMYDVHDEVIYVGKARNLKRRVSSYFIGAAASSKTAAMLAHVARVDVTITDTEDEALILESTLIKRHRPRYNILLRDDKSYPYLLITGDHEYPRVVYHRGAQTKKGHYLGPFPSSGAVKQTQDTLIRLFKLRNCSDSYFAARTRPCLQYQIKRCSAPCVGYISKTDYARDVADAVALLEGGNEKLTQRLVGEMQTASDALEFEQAAYLREKISALRRLQAQAQTVGGVGDFDIMCATSAGGVAAVVVVTVRGGMNLGHRSHYPRTPQDSTAEEIMTAFVSQYYLDRQPPREVLLDPAPQDVDWLTESLSQRAGRKVLLKSRVRGKRAQWLDNARATLAQTMSAYMASRAGTQQRLTALAEALGLQAPPINMACFDISHTRGEATVASCVVFESGAPKKSAYRRFNISDIEPGDDYAAMRQALTRRFQRVKEGEVPRPDLQLIDGGRGQLAVAEQVLSELGIQGVTLLGVAKGSTRKPGLEQLFLPGQTSPLILPADSPALHLIQQIRDESHRFAIAGHRGRRKKARQGSVLDAVEGLGPKRRKHLLQAFGGPRQVARASVSDLARVDGISATMAQRIYDHFH